MKDLQSTGALAGDGAATGRHVEPWHRDERRRQMQQFWESVAPRRDAAKRRNWYYYQEVERYCGAMVPTGARVLEVGCGNGSLLAALRPSYGVGIDFSPTSIAQARERYPHLRFFVDDVEDLQLAEPFDYIVISDVLGALTDVQHALECLNRVCHERTRIVITDYSHLWEPAIRIAQRAGWAMAHPQNWLPASVTRQILDIAGYEVIRGGGRMLLPLYIPALSSFMNRVCAKLPLLNRLCLTQTLVARPRLAALNRPARTTVVVPCRNERGTIDAIVKRVPDMGGRTEIIFVDGHSTDGTVEEIERAITDRPDRDIKLLRQVGTGKGDAVRLAFSRAEGDILMILDADLTVSPEELPKFHRVLVTGQAEFVNGTRLVYPMDDQAMQLLNLIANKLFSGLFTYLIEQTFHDTLCGTKVLRRDDYEQIVAQRSHFGDFDPFGDFDLLFGAARLNLHIKEIPVRYSARVYGETNIRRFAHGWLLFKMCGVAMRRLKYES